MAAPIDSVPPRAAPWDRIIAATPIDIQRDRQRWLRSRDHDTFCFGRFRLLTLERVLLKDEVPLGIGSRAFDLLLALLEHAGETVHRQELFERVWPDVIVAKVNLRVHIAGLRKLLGEGRDGNRFIISVACRGYRFVAPVSRLQPGNPASRSSRYATAPLSVRLERMIGRETTIARLSAQLAHRRFISVGGPGGWGCTSVAFTIAHTLVNDFDNAVCFVDLAGIDDPAGVTKAVALALQLEVRAQEPLLPEVLAYLRDKETLLVFDNCDDVAAGIARFAEQLFESAPLVHIVVSSRHALQLSHPST